NIDLAAYRLTVGNGNCYRGFYVSTWFTNHEFGYQTPKVYAYTQYPTGQLRGPWAFNHSTFWDWGNYVWTSTPGGGSVCETCDQLGPWGSYSAAVTLPNNRTQIMDFGISTGYGRIATTLNSNVNDCNPNCNFNQTSLRGGGWFIQSPL